MPKIAYRPATMRGDSLAIVARANQIIREYDKQGYRLTLRQLYYRFIAGDYFPDSWADVEYNRAHGLADSTKNTQKNYKRLGSIINDGRLQGAIDWDAIEDLGRRLMGIGYVPGPQAAINNAAHGYRIDLWAKQPLRMEIWVEKTALESICGRVGNLNRVDYFACKGYSSQSSMWGAARRIMRTIKGGQKVTILYLGDHDPSGVNMSADIKTRMKMFMGDAFEQLEIVRIALNMKQIEKFRPPPNPAKRADSRYRKYVERFGRECWELDALTPSQMSGMIQHSIDKRRDAIQWAADTRREELERADMLRVANNWGKVQSYVSKL